MYSKSYYIKKIVHYIKTNRKYIYKRCAQNFKKIYQNERVIKFNNLILGDAYNDISLECTVDIIIPIYNGYDFLIPLFSSIANDVHKVGCRLIIINDCSSDEKVIKLLDSFYVSFPSLSNSLIIHNDENVGFVRTVNKAYTYVNSPFFVILNTDTEVPIGWLQRLVSPLIKNSVYASATPWTNSGEIFSFPRWLENNDLMLGYNANEVDCFFREIDYNASYIDVPTGIGFCMAIRKSVVDKIGFLDENTFLKGFGEENDWCMRASASGYKHAFVTNLFVYHKHGGSFSSEEKLRLLERNSLKLIKKHPDFEEKIFDFILADPLASYRNIILFRLLRSKFESIIYFDMIQHEHENTKFIVSIKSINADSFMIKVECSGFCVSYMVDNLSNLKSFFHCFNLLNTIVISEKNDCYPAYNLLKND